jgi:hypothetical protein
MALQWLTNIIDPRPAQKLGIAEPDWLKNKVVGEPKASARYTVEDLKEIGFVGVYVETDGDETEQLSAEELGKEGGP